MWIMRSEIRVVPSLLVLLESVFFLFVFLNGLYLVKLVEGIIVP